MYLKNKFSLILKMGEINILNMVIKYIKKFKIEATIIT
jgi:hypothetical protein